MKFLRTDRASLVAALLLGALVALLLHTPARAAEPPGTAADSHDTLQVCSADRHGISRAGAVPAMLLRADFTVASAPPDFFSR